MIQHIRIGGAKQTIRSYRGSVYVLMYTLCFDFELIFGARLHLESLIYTDVVVDWLSQELSRTKVIKT